jgi:thioredoxin-related protein
MKIELTFVFLAYTLRQKKYIIINNFKNMKKIMIVAVLMFGVLAFTTKNTKVEPKAQTTEINWMSFEQAIAAQKANPKKIFIDAYTNWCGPCKLLDKNTFHNPSVVKYINEHYYAVKFNAEGNEKITFQGKTYTNPNYNPAKPNARNSSHQLSRYYRINSYPTMLFLDDNAAYLTSVKGYRTPKQLELYLKLFGENDYKTIKTSAEWESYQKNFNYTFE